MITPLNPSKRAAARVTNPLPVPTACPHCAGKVQIVTNDRIYGRMFGHWPWACLCSGCGAYVGFHPLTGIPLGTLATQPMREARKRAKNAFNTLWQGTEEIASMTRSEAYAWLAATLKIEPGACHVGWFDVAQCEATVLAVQERRP